MKKYIEYIKNIKKYIKIKKDKPDNENRNPDTDIQEKPDRPDIQAQPDETYIPDTQAEPDETAVHDAPGASPEGGSLRVPSIPELRAELDRVRYMSRYGRVFRSTVYTLITVAAVAILVATLWLPVLQTYGKSMTPTLEDGEIIITLKTTDFSRGDIISFYYNNKILVKRVIAEEGDWVNIRRNGNVYVNDELLDEPYVQDRAFGDCDIDMPYQVPDGKIFVMGDHRSTSLDSRNSALGCVAQEQIVGKIVFRIWPLTRFGAVG